MFEWKLIYIRLNGVHAENEHQRSLGLLRVPESTSSLQVSAHFPQDGRYRVDLPGFGLKDAGMAPGPPVTAVPWQSPPAASSPERAPALRRQKSLKSGKRYTWSVLSTLSLATVIFASKLYLRTVQAPCLGVPETPEPREKYHEATLRYRLHFEVEK